TGAVAGGEERRLLFLATWRYAMAMFTSPRCLSVSVFAFILACAAPSHVSQQPIKTEFVDGIVLLDVTLSGVQAWWLLDSGYECSVLDSTAARTSGISTSVPQKTHAPGGDINQASARGLVLHVSGETFRPDSVAVVSLVQLSPIVGRPITGILGHDFFEHHVV